MEKKKTHIKKKKQKNTRLVFTCGNLREKLTILIFAIWEVFLKRKKNSVKLNKLSTKNPTTIYKKPPIKNYSNGLKKKSDSELDIFTWKTESQKL